MPLFHDVYIYIANVLVTSFVVLLAMSNAPLRSFCVITDIALKKTLGLSTYEVSTSVVLNGLRENYCIWYRTPPHGSITLHTSCIDGRYLQAMEPRPRLRAVPKTC
jgi:hypothetical protein